MPMSIASTAVALRFSSFPLRNIRRFIGWRCCWSIAKSICALRWLKRARAHYLLDAESFDVIVGHRADDSYFTFARAFLRNDISLEQLTRALRLGDLGQQIVLKSPRAFEAIEFVEATVAPSAVYYPKRKERDEKARALYREEAAREGIDGIYLRDLLRDEVTDLAGL